MRIVFLCLFWLFTCSVAATEPTTRFVHFSLQHGLSQSTVVSAVQDKQGFLWFATQDGLNRFDGYDFKVYRHKASDPGAISDNFIRTLFLDIDGVLWVGTNAGLNKYDEKRDRFERFNHNPNNSASLSHNRVQAIYQDANQTLWVGTYDGLNQYDRQNGNFKRFKNSASDPHSITSNRIRALFADDQGTLWIGTHRGLNKFNAASGHFSQVKHQGLTPSKFNHANINVITQDIQGSLWIGGSMGLAKLNKQGDKLRRIHYQGTISTALADATISAIYPDEQGQLWLGTLAGLNKFDPVSGQLTQFKHDPLALTSLSHNAVLAIFKDNKGILWIGTNGGGLNKYDGRGQAFVHFKQQTSDPTSLSHNAVWALHQDKQGALWVGTDSGLSKYDEARKIFSHYKHQASDPQSLSNKAVVAIMQDSNEQLWVGTYGGGLNRFDPNTGQFSHFRFNSNDPSSLSNDKVRTLFEDDQGVLWVGTSGGGLNRFNAKTASFERFQHQANNPYSISHDTVNYIFADKTGVLWIATQGGGLNQFDAASQSFISFRHHKDDPSSLSHDDIRAIYQGDKGELWLATYGGGLNKFDLRSGVFKQYREQNSQITDNIYGLLPGRQNELWLSTTRGLSTFDMNTETFRHFDVNDGLQSNEFNHGAYYKGRSGELFFGGINGFNRFYPDKIEQVQQLPVIVFTDLLLFNRSVPVKVQTGQNKAANFSLPLAINQLQHLSLSYFQSPVSLQFAGLDFTNPMKNQYAYMLEGLDEDWIYTDAKNRRATYTNIPPGHYVLRVKASNKDGHWNETGKSLNIEVLPPPWLSWWAYVIYISMFGALVFAFVKIQRNKISYERSVNFQLEQKVAQRTVALKHAMENLEQASLTDQLTGANNRRYFNNFIDMELATLQRQYHKPQYDLQPDFAFLLVDIDHFKEINDNYGHDAGDRVLVQIVQIFRDSCRNTDWVIRWGAEEFLIVGRFLKRDELQKLLERIRQNVAATTFDLGNQLSTRLTCSIGATAFPFFHRNFDALTWQQSLHLSDLALLVAKNNGRNAWLCLSEAGEIDAEHFYQQAVADLQQAIDQKKMSYTTSFDHTPIKF